MVVESDHTIMCFDCSATVERDATYPAAPNISIGESVATSNWTCTSPSSLTTTSCGTYTAVGGQFTDHWSLGADGASPSGCGFDITDHWQWCPLAKSFATLFGYIRQLNVEINGSVSPGMMPGGTVIKP